MKYKKLMIALSAVGLILTGCSNKPRFESLTYTDTAFDTVVQVQIYDCDDESLIDNCSKICQDYEQMLSRTIETSDIAKINSSAGNPVIVSDETAELIRQGIYYGDLSDGAFDITIGTLTSLWDFSGENNVVPDETLINDAVSHIDYHNIKVNGNEVTLLDPDTKIDLGGIAKGYIADRIKAMLIQNNVEHALINLGGNVLALGNKTDGSDYVIGIKKPFDENGDFITTVKIHDQTVVTSGNYERYFKVDDKLYHHILDPSTGYPSENELNSVTIICNSSLTADALSTTCFLLGTKKGLELINSLDEVEAIFVDNQNHVVYSDNLAK